jgi:hypothetical protein
MLDEKDKRVLVVLAEDYEKNPTNHIRKGLSRNNLGAASSAYLNNIVYEVEHLVSYGYVNRLDALDRFSNIIITQKGYRYIRPVHVRVFHWITERKTISIIGAIVSSIGIIIGLMNFLKSC